MKIPNTPSENTHFGANFAPSQTRTDYSTKRPDCTIEVCFDNAHTRQREILYFKGTEKCADVVDFIRKLWNADGNALIVYCARTVYQEKNTDGKRPQDDSKTIGESLRSANFDGKDKLLIAFQPAKTEGDATSSSSYFNPAGAAVEGKPEIQPEKEAFSNFKDVPPFTGSMFIDYARNTPSLADCSSRMAGRNDEMEFAVDYRGLPGSIKFYFNGKESVSGVVDFMRRKFEIARNDDIQLLLGDDRIYGDMAEFQQAVAKVHEMGLDETQFYAEDVNELRRLELEDRPQGYPLFLRIKVVAGTETGAGVRG